MEKYGWLSVREAAEKLQMHEGSVRKLVADGRLATMRVDDRTYLISSAAVRRYLALHRQPARSRWDRKPPAE